MSRRERYERLLDRIWQLETDLGWEPSVRAPKRSGRMRTPRQAAGAWSASAQAEAANYSAGVSAWRA